MEPQDAHAPDARSGRPGTESTPPERWGSSRLDLDLDAETIDLSDRRRWGQRREDLASGRLGAEVDSAYGAAIAPDEPIVIADAPRWGNRRPARKRNR